MLVLLRGFTPLHIVLQVFLADDCLHKWAWETMCEGIYVGGVIEVDACMMCKAFETCDIVAGFARTTLP